MPDKTKAQLLEDLKVAEKRAKKAEKALESAQSEAETGVNAAQAAIDHLNEDVTRLRAERNDWRKTAGGKPGMRSSAKLTKAAVVQAVSAVPKTDENVIDRLRSERNAWRRAAGGVQGARGPNGTTSGPIQGSDVETRLRSERNAWRKAAGGVPGMRGPKVEETTVSEPEVTAEPVTFDPTPEGLSFQEIDAKEFLTELLSAEAESTTEDRCALLAKLLVLVVEEILS